MRVELSFSRRSKDLANPQLSIDGSRAYVAMTDPDGSANAPNLAVWVVPLPEHAAAQKAQTLLFPKRDPHRVSLALAPNEKTLAALIDGELWLKPLSGPAEAHRLYPPAEGDAPLGPGLSQVAYASDSSWLLVQSPKGWGHLTTAGAFTALPLPAVDLSEGSLALSPDGTHAIFVKPQRGDGFINGARIIAVNLATAFAQVLDRDHTYSEVLFLPEGTAAAKDTDGRLWLIQPASRIAYFTPPRGGGGNAWSYTTNLGVKTLAWVSRSEAKGRQAELWAAPAPSLPQRAKKAGVP